MHLAAPDGQVDAAQDRRPIDGGVEVFDLQNRLSHSLFPTLLHRGDAEARREHLCLRASASSVNA